MKTFIQTTITTIRKTTVTQQVTDICTDVLGVCKYTAQGTVGSTLVLTSATRLATQALAELAPKSKEQAEAQILAAIALMSDKVDTDNTNNTESDKESNKESEQALVVKNIS